jgi:hypothetical protein
MGCRERILNNMLENKSEILILIKRQVKLLLTSTTTKFQMEFVLFEKNANL